MLDCFRFMDKPEKKMARKTTGKKKAAKKAVRTEEFDSSKKHVFYVTIKLGPNMERTIDFVCGEKENLTYDDVLDSLNEVLEKDYPEEYFPKLDVDYSTLMIVDGSDSFHVFPESGVKAELAKLPEKPGRYLVLPECTYSISDEFKLYNSLCNKGMIDPEVERFDPDKMKAILEEISEGKKNVGKKQV